MRRAIVLVAAGLLLTACSSSAATKPALPTLPPVQPTTPASSTSPSVASPTGPTVAQWASLVAERSTPVKAALTGWAGCPTVIANPADSPTCSSRHLTLAFTIEAFGQNVKNGLTELGAPPIEVASLVVRTTDATDAWKKADGTYQAACVGGGSGPADPLACEKASGGWSTAEQGVVSMINAWAPYAH